MRGGIGVREVGLARLVFTRARTCRGHLLAVADQQNVADQHGMVPRLAIDRLELCDLFELIDRRRDEHDIPVFGHHEQEILIGQEHELTVAVAVPDLDKTKPAFTATTTTVTAREVILSGNVVVQIDGAHYTADQVVISREGEIRFDGNVQVERPAPAGGATRP